jgi:hypothetical protein
MIVFGGDNGMAANDVWALSLSETPYWTQLFPAGTLPPGRFLHSAIYDPLRDRMIVFGGNYWLDDVWELSFGVGLQWKQIAPHGPTPPARSSHAAIYDAARDRMVVFGGYSAGVYLSDVWELSLDNAPTWKQILHTGPSPNPRQLRNAVHDPIGDRMVIYGGYNHFIDGSMNDLWSLSLESPEEWTQIAVASALPAIHEHGVVLDAAGRLLAFGGAGNPAQCLSIPLADPNLWKFISPPTPPVSPAARSGHTVTHDPERRRLVVAGGNRRTYDPSTWALSLDTNRWQALATADPPGSFMHEHCAIHDPIGDRLIAFGGFGNQTGPWQLSMAPGSSWQPLPSGPTPPGRSGAMAIYDPVRRRMILFGGFYYDFYGWHFTYDDVWALSLEGTPAWTRLFPAGTTPSLAFSTAFYDPLRDRMVVRGGCMANLGPCKNPSTTPMWELSLGTSPAWSPIAQSGDIVPNRFPALLDAAADRMIVAGAVSPSFGVYETRVWARDLAAGSPWARLSTSGDAPVLGGKYFDAAFDPVARRALIAFTGDSPDDDDQVWAFTSTPVTGVPVATSRLALVGTSPNPATGPLRVTFELPSPAPATLELLDIAGRRLEARAVGALGAGRHALTLGESPPLAPGVYLLRLRQGAVVVSARVTVLK